MRYAIISPGLHTFQDLQPVLLTFELLRVFCLFVCLLLSKVIISKKAQKKENQMTDLVELTKFRDERR